MMIQGSKGHVFHACMKKHDFGTPSSYDKAILNRISRSAGHLKAVRRMAEDERDCSEVVGMERYAKLE